MSINLDSLLSSTEFNFSNRSRQTLILGRKCPQCEDGETSDTKDRLCRICGEELIDVSRTADASHILSHQAHGDTMNVFDLLGDDLRRAIQESLAQSLPDRQISSEYLSKLGKVVLDNRRGLLHDIVLCIGPLSIMGVLASFGPLPETEIACPIVFGDPEFGDAPSFSNSSSCTGSIVVLKRGKVSFAQKAIAASSSGATAVIVGQTFDIWPFVMTDSAGEIVELNLKIPVLMISQADLILLEKLIKPVGHGSIEISHQKTDPNDISVMSSSRNSMISKLICGRFEDECSICQEKMLEGETVLKLNCRHAYHATCVQSWLERHNTCPLCRNEMPMHKGPKKKQSGVAGSETSHDMPYFN
jgi:Ring finger domain/PA domain